MFVFILNDNLRILSEGENVITIFVFHIRKELQCSTSKLNKDQMQKTEL